MQRDMEAGKQSEVDGLIYQVVRLAEQYGVDVPEYRKIAEAVKNRRKISENGKDRNLPKKIPGLCAIGGDAVSTVIVNNDKEISLHTVRRTVTFAILFERLKLLLHGWHLTLAGADGFAHDFGRRRHLIDAHADGTRYSVENRRCDGHGRNLGNAFCAERAPAVPGPRLK